MPTTFKLCSFNCIYCHYGWTDVLSAEVEENSADLPTVEEVEQTLTNALGDCSEPQYITFSGNGEPTMHPNFDDMVDMVTSVRDKLAPRAKTCVLSNSTTVNRDLVRATLARLDLCIMKLDTGDERTWRQVNRPARGISYGEIVSGLANLDAYVLQTVFVNGEISNSHEEQTQAWVERLDEIRPKSVQIYSIDRPPADQRLQKVSRERLSEIADKAAEATGISVEVFAAR